MSVSSVRQWVSNFLMDLYGNVKDYVVLHNLLVQVLPCFSSY